MEKVTIFLEKNTYATFIHHKYLYARVRQFHLFEIIYFIPILFSLYLYPDFHSCMQYFEQGITKNGYFYMKQENNSISRVYCDFEGMDQRYSRYLIVSTGSGWGDKNRKVEIVDISDPTKNCNLLEDIQPQEVYTLEGKAGLLGKNPVICDYSECIVFGTSQKTIAMNKSRNSCSAVSLNSSMLWFLGSDSREGDYSTEFISLSGGRYVTAIYNIIKYSKDCR